jgi:hypothetical protein
MTAQCGCAGKAAKKSPPAYTRWRSFRVLDAGTPVRLELGNDLMFTLLHGKSTPIL